MIISNNKPIPLFWRDFDRAYLENDLEAMKCVMFAVEDAVELSTSSSYTWELHNTLHKIGELILKYEKAYNKTKEKPIT